MNFQLLFPVTLTGIWRDTKDLHVNDDLQSWLLDPSSLTTRLKSHCKNFRVELLGQHITNCDENEAVALIPAGEKVLIREVILFCDDTPQVFARSLLPLSSLTGEEQALASLGTQSLGQVLFNNPSLKRNKIEVAQFDQNSSIAILIKNLPKSLMPNLLPENLWGRRSIFLLENKPLMVAEVFLPGSYAYQKHIHTGKIDA